MSPIIYEPEEDDLDPHSQAELKSIYGEKLKEGSIIRHDGVYYKYITNYTYWRNPVFIKMNKLDVWWNKKRGHIK